MPDDFDGFSWHDNIIYGLSLDVGDPDRDTWHCRLVLDIDHIVEWLRGEADGMRFRVAPATLTFEDVGDLRIAVDYGDSGGRRNINEMSIAEIVRMPLAHPSERDIPYWRWRIALNWPRGGEIFFAASGFRQDLRAEPVLLAEQRFSSAARPG
jgi:hypothetical protein